MNINDTMAHQVLVQTVYTGKNEIKKCAEKFNDFNGIKKSAIKCAGGLYPFNYGTKYLSHTINNLKALEVILRSYHSFSFAIFYVIS